MEDRFNLASQHFNNRNPRSPSNERPKSEWLQCGRIRGEERNLNLRNNILKFRRHIREPIMGYNLSLINYNAI